MTGKEPYYIKKVINNAESDLYSFYCTGCHKWHNKNEAPFIYLVGFECNGESNHMAHFRTCKADLIKPMVNKMNEAHFLFIEKSVNKNFPILI